MLRAIKRSEQEKLWTSVKGHHELESGSWVGEIILSPPAL